MAGLDFPLSNASPVSSRKPAHDSGPNRYALPSFVRLFHPLLSSGFNRRFPCPLFVPRVGGPRVGYHVGVERMMLGFCTIRDFAGENTMACRLPHAPATISAME